MEQSTFKQMINVLNEKFGLSADCLGELIPQIRQYNIVRDLFYCLILVLLLVLGFYVLKAVVESSKTESKWHFIYVNNLETGLLVFGIVDIVVSIITLICIVAEIIGWVFGPDVKAIEYIIRLMQ